MSHVVNDMVIDSIVDEVAEMSLGDKIKFLDNYFRNKSMDSVVNTLASFKTKDSVDKKITEIKLESRTATAYWPI